MLLTNSFRTPSKMMPLSPEESLIFFKPKLEAYPWLTSLKRNEEETRSKSLYQPVLVYITFIFYTCQCPFKPVFVDGRWVLKKFRLQQVISVLSWLLTLIYSVTNAKLVGINWISSSSVKYFQLLRHIFFCAQFLTTAWILFTASGQCKIEHLVNQIHEYSSPLPTAKWKERLGQLLISAGIFTCGLVTFLQVLVSQGKWMSQEGLRSFVNMGRIRFYMSAISPSTNTSEASTMEEFCTGDVLLGVTEFVLDLAHQIRYLSMVLLFWVPVPFTIWLAVSNFADFMEDIASKISQMRGKGSQVMGAIISEFYKVKRLTDSVNKTWSFLMLLWIVENVMGVVFYFQHTVTGGDGVSIATFAGYTLLLIATLVTSAEVQRKMSWFTTWLASQECRQNFWNDELQWMATVKEVGIATVGIGVDGMFQINYSFLSQLLALTITLFIVSFEK